MYLSSQDSSTTFPSPASCWHFDAGRRSRGHHGTKCTSGNLLWASIDMLALGLSSSLILEVMWFQCDPSFPSSTEEVPFPSSSSWATPSTQLFGVWTPFSIDIEGRAFIFEMLILTTAPTALHCHHSNTFRRWEFLLPRAVVCVTLAAQNLNILNLDILMIAILLSLLCVCLCHPSSSSISFDFLNCYQLFLGREGGREGRTDPLCFQPTTE